MSSDGDFSQRGNVRADLAGAANIAEGCGRSTTAELGRFLQIAMGSASELEYHLLLARDLNYLDASLYEALNNDTIEIKKMLTSLVKNLKADG
jgi:four helix bundle protein